MGTPRFIAIVGCQHHFGSAIFKPGQRVKLTKDPENPHDAEAIKVELDPVGQVGYVANSVHTVPRGCCSAGRICDSFAESIQGLVRFVTKDLAIVEIDQQ